MHCPRCKTAITQSFDPDSIVPCPGCGARLMTRAAALRSLGGPRRPAKRSAQDAGAPERESAGTAASPAPRSKLKDVPPSTTMPPTPARTPPPRPPAPQWAPAEGPSREPEEEGEVTLERLLQEIVHIRKLQREILAALRQAGAPAISAEPAAEEEPILSPVRSRRRKSVVVIDDDPKTREAALAALQQADVPVRGVADGQAALRAIAEEKPDVIALELGLHGDMAGRDVINMIKATMEWVDIPIVLWTREPVTTQKEARQVHGADELVPKKSGPEALVTRVITIFRRA